ncbi:ABC transporter ATP-binding protein [Methanoregula sp.]|jgi:lipopolysaccharide transport system ATP-binding protein|uniref:ABC transporter ATP-binding protein n=1 Tax=Methanoregula sp. TaxID=2052170 RepID=UPI0035632EE7
MIKVEGISKQFKLYRSPADRLKEIVYRKKYHKKFVALDNISFEVRNGETLGIIGQNGAGKSTLLKILSGIVIPDRGTIQVDGKVTGLLELGTGFNAEMTGLENIYMNGTLIGMTKDELDRKKQTIIDFSELGDFINEPIKTYSSGMTMRLAFSIAIHADPTCFLVDEALSVGDAYFQQKCMRKIQEFRAGGGSIVFVSHDMNAVKTLCDSAIMLDHGREIDCGEPKDVVDFYQNMVLKKMHQGDVPVQVLVKKGGKECTENNSGISTGEVELVSFKVCNEKGEEISYIESENVIKIIYEIKSHKDLDEPHYGLMIRNNLGLSIFETNTYCMKMKTQKLSEGQTVKIEWTMDFPLSPGTYSFSVGVANKGFDIGSFEEYIQLIQDIEIIKVLVNTQSIMYSGIFNLNPKISLDTHAPKNVFAK